MRLDTLVTAHRACGVAQEHCGHIGLRYTDAKFDLEREMQRQLDEGAPLPRQADNRADLTDLIESGVLHTPRRSAYRD